jgi:hypothetical protein
MARSGLSANEIAPALTPMMARSEMLQSKAGYIDARPLPSTRHSLATHGRTIHWVIHAICELFACPLLPESDTKADAQKWSRCATFCREQMQQNASLDYLISDGNERWRHGQSKYARGRVVDDELELG